MVTEEEDDRERTGKKNETQRGSWRAGKSLNVPPHLSIHRRQDFFKLFFGFLCLEKKHVLYQKTKLPRVKERSLSRLNWNRELYSFIVSHLR